MKRYAIVDLGEMDLPENPNYYDNVTGKLFPVLSGPVELMQAATKEAGVISRKPQKGDLYFDNLQERWIEATCNWCDSFRPVIPATEPEPKKPCPNCQNIKNRENVKVTYRYDEDYGVSIKLCRICGRHVTEWTYASERWTAEWQVSEPGGIGGGGTGGPI